MRMRLLIASVCVVLGTVSSVSAAPVSIVSQNFDGCLSAGENSGYALVPISTGSEQIGCVTNAHDWYSEFKTPAGADGGMLAFNSSEREQIPVYRSSFFDVTAGEHLWGDFTAGAIYPLDTPTLLAYLTINGNSLLVSAMKLGTAVSTAGWDISAFTSGVAYFTLETARAAWDGYDGMLDRVDVYRDFTEPIPVVPEPRSVVLVGLGLFGLAFYRQRLGRTAR